MSSKGKGRPDSEAVEQEKVKQLRAALGLLEGREAIFVSESCLHQYLRARNGDVKKAERMLRNTLKWRAEYKPEEIKWAEVAHESTTGKLYRTPFLDKKRDSVVVMAPGRQNTTDHDGQIRHLVFCLENAVTCLPAGRESMLWLIDFRGWTLKTSPPMKTTRETLSILQNHYPERLGMAVLYDPPGAFELFYKLVKPFIDPKTVKKIVFLNSKTKSSVEVIESLFDLENLDASFGGRSTWVYEHDKYSKMMVEDDLRTAQKWGLPLPSSPSPATNGTATLPAS